MSKELVPGDTVYFQSVEESWILGKLVSIAPGKVKGSKLYTCSSSKPPLENSKLTDADVHPIRPELLGEDVHDLLSLKELHESTLLACLKLRYLRDVVYTNIGAITVALNPFNFDIPHYLDCNMEKYFAEGSRIQENLPHSWAAAHNTYFEMLEMDQDQSILVSGESGAGKTEAAKIVLKYIGSLSARRAKNDAQRELGMSVRHRILQASPILEAWGNAKTVRNDNSSRFGKFMRVQFDRDGILVGAESVKYLLEKSRVVTAAAGERVYHVFYQLLSGPLAAKFELGQIGDYVGCRAGGDWVIRDVDDGKDFMEQSQAFEDVGISPADRDLCFQCLAGILELMNVTFEGTDTASVSDSKSAGPLPSTTILEKAARHFGIDYAKLRTELEQQNILMGKEFTVRKNKPSDAAVVRDSICKALYDALFEWLVVKINLSTAAAPGKYARWIGLLDIFGFEDFAVNSFEQLCINLTNETLQNHYNHHVFNKDMEECRAEGIDVTSVEFQDNAACLQLLTGKLGIFRLLDDTSQLDHKGDLDFLQDVDKSVPKGHPFYEKKPQWRDMFVVKHYAGDVQYTVGGFIDKNKDSLKTGPRLLLRTSTFPLIADLISPPAENARGRQPTVSGTFVAQVTDLMNMINSTNPHWIRCIKPHPAKRPLMFSGPEVMRQLRSSGVLETVRMRKAGFPIRLPRNYFICRYKCLFGLPKAPTRPAEDEETCLAIFKLAELSNVAAQNGKTKVFLRTFGYDALEETRKKALRGQAVVIQSYCREKKPLKVRKAMWYLQRLKFIQSFTLCLSDQHLAIARRKIIAVRWLQGELREWLVVSRATRTRIAAEKLARDKLQADEREKLLQDCLKLRPPIEQEEAAVRIELAAAAKAGLATAILQSREYFLNMELKDRLTHEKEEEKTRDKLVLAFHEKLDALWELDKQRLAELQRFHHHQREDLCAVETEERALIEKLNDLHRNHMERAFMPVKVQIQEEFQRSVRRYKKLEARIARAEQKRALLLAEEAMKKHAAAVEGSNAWQNYLDQQALEADAQQFHVEAVNHQTAQLISTFSNFVDGDNLIPSATALTGNGGGSLTRFVSLSREWQARYLESQQVDSSWDLLGITAPCKCESPSGQAFSTPQSPLTLPSPSPSRHAQPTLRQSSPQAYTLSNTSETRGTDSYHLSSFARVPQTPAYEPSTSSPARSSASPLLRGGTASVADQKLSSPESIIQRTADLIARKRGGNRVETNFAGIVSPPRPSPSARLSRPPLP